MLRVEMLQSNRIEFKQEDVEVRRHISRSSQEPGKGWTGNAKWCAKGRDDGRL